MALQGPGGRPRRLRTSQGPRSGPRDLGSGKWTRTGILFGFPALVFKVRQGELGDPGFQSENYSLQSDSVWPQLLGTALPQAVRPRRAFGQLGGPRPCLSGSHTASGLLVSCLCPVSLCCSSPALDGARRPGALSKGPCGHVRPVWRPGQQRAEPALWKGRAASTHRGLRRARPRPLVLSVGRGAEPGAHEMFYSSARFYPALTCAAGSAPRSPLRDALRPRPANHPS